MRVPEQRPQRGPGNGQRNIDPTLELVGRFLPHAIHGPLRGEHFRRHALQNREHAIAVVALRSGQQPLGEARLAHGCGLLARLEVDLDRSPAFGGSGRGRRCWHRRGRGGQEAKHVIEVFLLDRQVLLDREARGVVAEHGVQRLPGGDALLLDLDEVLHHLDRIGSRRRHRNVLQRRRPTERRHPTQDPFDVLELLVGVVLKLLRQTVALQAAQRLAVHGVGEDRLELGLCHGGVEPQGVGRWRRHPLHLGAELVKLDEKRARLAEGDRILEVVLEAHDVSYL